MGNINDLQRLKQSRIIAMRKSMNLSKENGLNIYKNALRRLDNDGFNIDNKGSQYIADLINLFYHERKLLEKYYKRPSYQGYWDLSDIKNPHYINIGNGKFVISEMRNEIIKSPYEDDDADLNELIYDLTDIEIARCNEDNRRYDEQISYKKLLLK